MSTLKKRKLDRVVVSAPLSAIAARRAKVHAATEDANTKGDSKTPNSRNESASVVPDAAVDKYKQDIQDAPQVQNSVAYAPKSGPPESVLVLNDAIPSSSYESRAESPELPIPRPSIIFSTLRPSKETIKELTDGSLLVRLAPGERLVLLGQCEISVKKGQVTLLGSTLQSSKASYRLSAPSSQSLPVIRCLGTDVASAEIRLRQCETGLDSLKTLSALFGSLWNDHYGPLSKEHSHLLKGNGKSSFKILLTSQDGPSKGFLQPLISPPEWNAAIARISDSNATKAPSIMLCGPKSSGKSTFAKVLANRLLSTPQGCKTGVAILDLDPGQPEYSSPGQLSLVHIQEPNFGPPFSHPIPGGLGRVIRSHAIGAISPSLDPSLYMACALDLFAHYRHFLSSTANCPLVINTPGWVLGTGLEILVDLIAKAHPTEVIYMSLDGPSEVVDSLREASKIVPLWTLPSQGSEYATRTAAHLRTMQNMSYFHLDSSTKTNMLSWNDIPLTSIPPWQVGYSGNEQGILGVICYGEQPPASLLHDIINGSLVAVVVIDDMIALPGFLPDIEYSNIGDETGDQKNYQQDADIHILDEETFHPFHLETPIILRNDEEIPYFNPANAVAIDPRYSHTIGLALVRGIDIEKRCLQLLTPISATVLEQVKQEGKKIVLVSGKLDTPGWAYTEELVQSDLRAKAARRKAADVAAAEIEEDEEAEERLGLASSFRDVPWIERLHGSQGRGVGSRVWRVRRDLGGSGDGD